MAYYKDMNEYRWEFINIGQGHYPLHKNLENAIKNAKKEANKRKDIVAIQCWKPKGKKVYLIPPTSMKGWSKNTIISYYKDKGYDISLIKSSKYILKG